MDLLGKRTVFSLIILVMQQRLVSTQNCFFDGGNSYISQNVSEFSGLGVVGDFRSGSVIDIDGLPIEDDYIELSFDIDGDGPVGILSVELNKSLEDYFRNPVNSEDQFVLPSFFSVCDDGSRTEQFLTIKVIDQNERPDFEVSKDIFEIKYPWDLNVPLNYETDIFTVDWDYLEEFSNQIVYTTSDPRITVEFTPMWNMTTPRPRRNSLKIKLLEQLTEPLTFDVIATDAGLVPVEKSFTIQFVDLTNILPPTFDEEHFYKFVIPDFPKQDERIVLDMAPMKVSDAENIPFTVSSTSDLIRIVEEPLNSGEYYAYFERDVSEDDIKDFDRGVGLIYVTATQTIPDGKQSSVVLLLYFNKVLTTEPTDSTTYSTVSTEETTEHTCTPCTTFSTESTSITCPDTSTISSSTVCPEISTVCPESTTTDAATTCPEVTCEPTTEASSTATTDCPENTTVYVSTPCPDTCTTENTPDTSSSTGTTDCPETTTVYVSTPCPESTSTENSADTSSSTGTTDCPETTTVYVSTPCPESTSTENSPDTSETSTPVSTSPVTDCPDVCTTETSETTSLTTCPESTTIYVSTPCSDSTSSTENTPPTSETSACPVTDCPDICSTTTSGSESSSTGIPCVPVPCEDLSTTSSDCSCPPCMTTTTSSPCPSEEDSDCSTTGYIVGLVVLSVLFVGAAGAAGYLWYMLRRRSNNPFEKFTAEPWIPETIEEKATSFSVENSPPDTSPYNGITYADPPTPTTEFKPFSVESEPPIISEPVNFGSKGRASQPELSQATNLLVENPAPIIPAIVPPPAIPRPDYPVGVVFDERVEVFTPTVQEYSDDEGGDRSPDDAHPALNSENDGVESERL